MNIRSPSLQGSGSAWRLVSHASLAQFATLVSMTLMPRLLRTEDAATYCGVSISLWAELVKQGAAPKPIELSKRVKVWDRVALDNWIDRLGQPASDGFGSVN